MRTTDPVELWLPVPESYLEVSDRGRVRSRAWGKLRALACAPNTSGYPAVAWWWQGHRRSALVRRLVLEAFDGPCPEGMEARHSDGDRGNCRRDNLAWQPRAKAQPQGGAARKLCRVQVVEIQRRLLAGETTRSIAARFGVSSVSISKINRGKSWSHVTPPAKGNGEPTYPLSTATRWSRREGTTSPPAPGEPLAHPVG